MLASAGERSAGAPPRAVDAASANGTGASTHAVYTDPRFTTHIVAGSPGYARARVLCTTRRAQRSRLAFARRNQEPTKVGWCGVDNLQYRAELAPSLARCIDAYGYGELQVANATHLRWRWKMVRARHRFSGCARACNVQRARMQRFPRGGADGAGG